MKLEEALQTSNFKDAKHKASLNILYTAWWLKTAISRELKAFSLTHEQFNVMRILKGKAPASMCVKDIAGRMIEKGTNVPRIIDKLVDKKLVKRATDMHDKRHTVMQLTASGLALLEKATKKINQVADTLVDLSDKEAGQLNLILEKMRAHERRVNN
ncbi:MAG: MarR family winged helix-turn-helix transcriptional regulator [Bacteroidota bacterium]